MAGCYWFGTDLANGVTWSQAKDYCLLKGSRLAEPTNALKQATLKYLAEMQAPFKGNWWLGASDAASEGNWLWNSGHTWEYTAWGAVQPDNLGNQDCLQLWGEHINDDSNYYKWDDAGCTNANYGAGMRPVCEWPQ